MKKLHAEVITVGSIVRLLYKAARTANDVSKVSSGKPSRVAKRAANKAVGRGLISKLFFK
ncbi:hypothetical protein KGY64_02450 [Candidatus Bipolaricaulota bacterium]|nr:hypothetical protein [Candidatus Bipolaricaulota bacterium]